MIRELSIRDYVLVEDVQLELGPGLTVLTGETGAGKSLLVGALRLLLGDRADAAGVRSGAARAVVQATFDLSGRILSAELGEELEGDSELIVVREVSAQGRSRAWVQGRRVPVARLREVTSALVDLHGQHDHQSLLQVATHRDLLDEVGGTADQRAAIEAAHAEAARARDVLEERRARIRALEERCDMFRFQLDELVRAELVAGEEDELEAEVERLSHAETIAEARGRAAELLGADERSVQELLGRALGELRRVADFDPDAQEGEALLEESVRSVDEALRRIDVGDLEGANPRRLDELQTRLSKLADFRRKYRVEHAGLLVRRDWLADELRDLERADDDVAQLAAEFDTANGNLARLARQLTAARRVAGRRIESSMESELQELGMAGARFEVAIEAPSTGGGTPGGAEDSGGPGSGPEGPRDGTSGRAELFCAPHGADRVEFRIAANPGEPSGPLRRVASGGEMSRVMLALKTILADAGGVPLLVFDEVDAGIGGETASRVARKLAALAEGSQVLAITHLPTIAAVAQSHLRVEKRQSEGRTLTDVRGLDPAEREEEVARMLGGGGGSAVAEHARALLAAAPIGPAGDPRPEVGSGGGHYADGASAGVQRRGRTGRGSKGRVERGSRSEARS